MARRWPVIQAADDGLPRTRRKASGNQLASIQEKKPNLCVDKSPDIGDWFVVGMRADGSRLVIATETTKAKAQAKKAFFLANGLDGYLRLTVEWSMLLADGSRRIINGDDSHESEDEQAAGDS